jgi:hypothetical protein
MDFRQFRKNARLSQDQDSLLDAQERFILSKTYPLNSKERLELLVSSVMWGLNPVNCPGKNLLKLVYKGVEEEYFDSRNGERSWRLDYNAVAVPRMSEDDLKSFSAAYGRLDTERKTLVSYALTGAVISSEYPAVTGALASLLKKINNDHKGSLSPELVVLSVLAEAKSLAQHGMTKVASDRLSDLSKQRKNGELASSITEESAIKLEASIRLQLSKELPGQSERVRNLRRNYQKNIQLYSEESESIEHQLIAIELLCAATEGTYARRTAETRAEVASFDSERASRFRSEVGDLLEKAGIDPVSLYGKDHLKGASMQLMESTMRTPIVYSMFSSVVAPIGALAITKGIGAYPASVCTYSFLLGARAAAVDGDKILDGLVSGVYPPQSPLDAWVESAFFAIDVLTVGAAKKAALPTKVFKGTCRETTALLRLVW